MTSCTSFSLQATAARSTEPVHSHCHTVCLCMCLYVSVVLITCGCKFCQWTCTDVRLLLPSSALNIHTAICISLCRSVCVCLTLITSHSAFSLCLWQGRCHEFHNGGYKIVHREGKKIFVPPIRISWGGTRCL